MSLPVLHWPSAHAWLLLPALCVKVHWHSLFCTGRGVYVCVHTSVFVCVSYQSECLSEYFHFFL